MEFKLLETLYVIRLSEDKSIPGTESSALSRVPIDSSITKIFVVIIQLDPAKCGIIHKYNRHFSFDR
jgi:hypothetical protein